MNTSTKKEEMKPLSEVMNMLSREGYTEEFKMCENGLTSQNTESAKEYKPEDLTITKKYRFEGESDPGDESVLYAIETNDGKKGMVLNAYGTYGDVELDEFLKCVKSIAE